MITNMLEQLTFQHLNNNPTPLRFRKIPFREIQPDATWADRQRPMVKRRLSNWSLIEMRDAENAVTFVVGSAADGEWVTSYAEDIPPAFAPDFSGVITPSGSFYELGRHNEGDPNLPQTLMIVSTLRFWGYGKAVSHFPEVVF